MRLGFLGLQLHDLRVHLQGHEGATGLCTHFLRTTLQPGQAGLQALQLGALGLVQPPGLLLGTLAQRQDVLHRLLLQVPPGLVGLQSGLQVQALHAQGVESGAMRS